MAAQPLYEVVSPVGQAEVLRDERKVGRKSPAASLADLNGKKIGLVWTVFTNGNVLLEALRDRTIGAHAREHGIDAAIVTAAC